MRVKMYPEYPIEKLIGRTCSSVVECNGEIHFYTDDGNFSLQGIDDCCNDVRLE